jgi:hypothetical protein
MKKRFVTFLLSFLPLAALSAPVWILAPDGGIRLDPVPAELPYHDHIEMSGQMMSSVIRWGVETDGRFTEERSLVFPMLRTVPNNTHASLMHRIGTDIPSLLSVNGLSLKLEQVKEVEVNGFIRVLSSFALGKANIGLGTGTAPKPSVELTRFIFPSVDKPLLGETYTLVNVSDRAMTVYVPAYSQVFKTLAEKGVDGVYVVRADLRGTGTFVVEPGDSVRFGAVFQAYRESEKPLEPDLETEFSARRSLVAGWDSNLVLETPDAVIDREFRFAKIRASESIYKTKGGFMHGPGGESYYAAIWANDQAEYVNPFFPFLGYGVGNESALNAYRHFARFMNDGFKPIPSSIIAEGIDIWNGTGDRGDAAMIAHGAARYALARGDRAEAETLWPLIAWCLEYCDRQLNAEGVVQSDSDELEGRFPSGDANLCTSTLYYDALLSAAMLAKSLGKKASVATGYRAKAARLAKAIEAYFGADVQGFHTYRYYDGNTVLRSWICMPLIVGLPGREEGTIAALTSPLLLTDDGVLTEQGSETFWDRSTLYTLRGIYIAGDIDTANRLMHSYSERRLLGTHVPYPIEAWPEGSQRHLSAESGLYCRAVIEGMFGLRPTGLRSFTLTPRLAAGWDRMALRHVMAFGTDFDIEAERGPKGLTIRITDHTASTAKVYRAAEGTAIPIAL